jgi:L-ribulose-5-phosphate 3-epimerase UlaE
LYPDIGNLAAAGYCPPDELSLAKGQLLAIHVKDAMPRIIRGIPFGKGIVPFRETFRALVQSGFWGMIGIEMWGNMHADQDPIAGVAEARKFVDSLVTEAWPAEGPCSQLMNEKHHANDPSEKRVVSGPETESDFRNR